METGSVGSWIRRKPLPLHFDLMDRGASIRHLLGVAGGYEKIWWQVGTTCLEYEK